MMEVVLRRWPDSGNPGMPQREPGVEGQEEDVGD
jgi:hypothetical protein